MGYHYAEIMKELNAKNDEVALLHAQRSDRDAVIQNAEVHIRTAEAALFILNDNSEMLPCLWHEKSLLDNMPFFFKLNNKQNAKRWNRRPRPAV